MSQARTPVSIDLKIAIFGTHMSGKTALCQRYIRNRYVESESTIGAAFASQDVVTKTERIKMAIWDMSGNPRFESLYAMYLRQTDCVVVCIDPTEKNLPDLQATFTKIKTYAKENALIVIVETKYDLANTSEYLITHEQIVESYSKAAKFVGIEPASIRHCSVSAKTGVGVKDLFESVIIPTLRTPQNMQVNEERVASNFIISPAEVLMPLNKLATSWGWNSHRSRIEIICMVLQKLLEDKSQKNLGLASFIVLQQKNWLQGIDKESVEAEAVAAYEKLLPEIDKYKEKYRLYLFSPSKQNDQQKVKEGKCDVYNALAETEKRLQDYYDRMVLSSPKAARQ